MKPTAQHLYLGPAPLNITAIAGDTMTIQLTLVDNETGDPLDLTGLTPHMQVRSTPGDTTIAATATVTVTDATGGMLVAVIDAADTAPLKGQHVYDLELRGAGGDPQTVIGGRLTFDEDVTRA